MYEVKMHPTIAVLKRLKYLNLAWCESIKSLPSEVEMDSLKIFTLLGCYNVKNIPEFGEQMKNVSWMNLSMTAIKEIPSSIGHLVGLKLLDLCACKNLKKIPKFGEQMKNVSRIDLGGTTIEEITSSIGHLMGLKELNLGKCKNLLNLPMVIYSLKPLEVLVFDKTDEGSDAKVRHGCGLLRCLGLEKSRPDPPRWGVELSSLTHLCSLTELNLTDCNLHEGDVPDDIGRCLSFLEKLHLSGNNFVSLLESIRCLSKLWCLDLERCKSLQELPPLPSEGLLHVNVCNCTSLKRLLDPSKMMSRYTDICRREESLPSEPVGPYRNECSCISSKRKMMIRCTSIYGREESLPSEPEGPFRRACICTSLKWRRLEDTSKMMTRCTYNDGREYFCYKFFCLNNVALAHDEGWIYNTLNDSDHITSPWKIVF